MKWLRNRIELLKNDKELAIILLLHLLLIALHVYENYVGNIEYHWHLRASVCVLLCYAVYELYVINHNLVEIGRLLEEEND